MDITTMIMIGLINTLIGFGVSTCIILVVYRLLRNKIKEWIAKAIMELLWEEND